MPTAGSIIFYDSGGNLSEDNSNLFWDNTNKRVGIGTASPNTGLDVRDVVTADYQKGFNGRYSTGSAVTLAKVDTGALGIINGISNANIFGPSLNGFQIGNTSAGIAGRADTASYRGLSFFSNGSEYMRIDSNGNVGIGTTSPNAQLEIAKNAVTGPRLCLNNTNATSKNSAIRFVSNGNSIWEIGTDELGNGGTELIFHDGTATRVTFKNGGQVGIGVSPSANILTHVYGSGSSFKHATYSEIAYGTGIAGTKIGVFGVVTGSAVGDAYGSAGVFGRTSTYTTVGSGYGVPVGTFGDCDPIGQYANPATTSGRDYVQFAIEADCWSIHESAAGVRAVLKTNDASGRAIWGSASPTGSGYAGYFEGRLNISKKANQKAILEMASNTADPSSTSVGQLYVKNGALYYCGTSGTITKLADA